MNRMQALRLTLQSLKNARVRVILLAALMVTGITGRMLYGYFFGYLVTQAAQKGETHRVPLVCILPPGRDIQHIFLRHANRHGGSIEAVTGMLSPVYTSVGRIEMLSIDWPGFQARYEHLQVTGQLPSSPGEVALPQHLSLAAGARIGDYFQVTTDPNLRDWVTLQVVGTFRVNAKGNIPPTLLDRPLVSAGSTWLAGPEPPPPPAPTISLPPGTTMPPPPPTMSPPPPEGGPHNVGIILGWTTPPSRFLFSGAANTPRQLAIQLRTIYNLAYQTETAGFWGWDSLPVFMPGDWARQATTILSRSIYGDSSRILGMGYAFIALGIYSVLIIALISRRRELAINKTIGLSPRQLVFVFGLEVAAVSAASFTVGSIAVWFLGRRVASVMGLESSVSPGIMLQTLATMGVLVVMASAIPLAMAAAATVNQLLYGQKIYLFKRSVLLRVDGGGEG